MTIIFYSTCSTIYDGNTFHYKNKPLCKEKLNRLIKEFPDYKFIVIAQKPGMFLLDLENNQLKEKSENVKYVITEDNISTEDFTLLIIKENPDLVIPLTGYFRPYDWQGIKDSIIAENLKKQNIQTLSSSIKTQELCFNKEYFQNFLEQNNFNVPKGLFINHQLFWAERNHKEIKENVYKEKIFFQLQKLKFPLIIKDTTGLSSFGMETVTTFNQTKAFLTSKKNNGDKLIQELIEGKQFGLEVYGKPGNYFISDPFMFSVNQYKITSPKQSIKIGPVNKTEYEIPELKKEIKRLCNLLNIQGAAQIDLVFDGQKWFIIEINPRLSGMTNTVLEAYSTNYFFMMIKAGLNIPISESPSVSQRVMSIKLPLISTQMEDQLLSTGFIKQVNQTINEEAKQEREKGFCEIIINSSDSNLKNNLNLLKSKYPELVDEDFYNQALQMLKELE